MIAVTLAMERKNATRELTSVLISDLCGRYMAEPDVERGFEVLLKSLPELILDTPTATDILGSFIARAVADDCIPPKFVNMYKVIFFLNDYSRYIRKLSVRSADVEGD